jgi:PHP family Zn ribbon phosphoesterase
VLSTIINVDLHIHSKISEYKEIPGLVDESDSQHLNVLLAALNKNGINFFAFSDHNRFDSDLFNKAKQIIDSENNPYPSIKNIVPSVEFDVQIDEGHEPCHILVIFRRIYKSVAG